LFVEEERLMAERIGKDTIKFTHEPCVAAWSATVGPKEGEGPLGGEFDVVLDNDLLGEKSHELAESRMYIDAVDNLLRKAGTANSDLDMLIGGDLVNQIMATNFAARELDVPLLGVYGACSTIAEALAIGACMIDGGSARRVVAAASSHFGTAERNYRVPLEMGGVRAPSAQWTVTGAGATLLCGEAFVKKPAARITHATFGRVTDLGIRDATNMGAVMAPAAARTFITHLRDTGRTPDYYDLILTGDLASVGHALFHELLLQQDIYLDESRSKDCGMMIYSKEQDVNAGGSGCGCGAVVLNGLIMRKIAQGELRRVAFMATGALLSATSALQGETIPSVAHLVSIERAE
jgi:stage V sporulation protein AD